MLRSRFAFAALVLITSSSVTGCTSQCTILSASVESAEEPSVWLVIDVDTDPGAPPWDKHLTRFNYVIMDQARRDRVAAVVPDLPADLSAACRALLPEVRHCFTVFATWPKIAPQERVDRSGAIRAGEKVGEGRWRFRMAIPFRGFTDWSPDDPQKVNYDRTDVYLLRPGHTYLLAGRLFAAQMISSHLISNIIEVEIRVPAK